MSVLDQIVRILNSSETHRVRFSFTGAEGVVNVTPDLFTTAAASFRSGQIAIVENFSAFGNRDIAQYSAASDTNRNANTLYLGRNQRSSRLFNALIVHEALHAAFDINQVTMPWIDNECAGYIAQAYYARNSGLPRTAYLYGSHAIIAYSIVEGMRSHSDSDVTFFLGALKDNLRNDPLYSSYINDHFAGDGVG